LPGLLMNDPDGTPTRSVFSGWATRTGPGRNLLLPGLLMNDPDGTPTRSVFLGEHPGQDPDGICFCRVCRWPTPTGPRRDRFFSASTPDRTRTESAFAGSAD